MNKPSLEQFGYTQELKRSLGVWQLTAFGLNYMIPLSPAIFFGFVLALSGGTVALPFIIAGIAVFFTAMSYAVMVQHFPLAGSLYNFVSQVWNKRIGFLAGWMLLLDYLFITAVTSMSASLYFIQLVHVPYLLVLFIFIAITGVINLLGIQLVARLGLILLGLAELIVLLSFLVWGHAIIARAGHIGSLFSSQPFAFTNIHTLMSATALAIASYLGFDAITTLTEEAQQPLKNIPKAIYLCVLLGGIGMVVTGYLALLACPNWPELIHDSNWQATALFYISKQAGGEGFAVVYSIGFIISMAVFNIVATAATARLLFGMGRDCVISKRLFGSVNQRFKTPHWNILLIMGLCFIVGYIGKIDQLAKLVNYGALFGFAVLNAAVVALYFKQPHASLYVSSGKRFCFYVLFPAIGFAVITWVLMSLDTQTHICGTAWLLLGLVYLAIHRKATLPDITV